MFKTLSAFTIQSYREYLKLASFIYLYIHDNGLTFVYLVGLKDGKYNFYYFEPE